MPAVAGHHSVIDSPMTRPLLLPERPPNKRSVAGSLHSSLNVWAGIAQTYAGRQAVVMAHSNDHIMLRSLRLLMSTGLSQARQAELGVEGQFRK